ncbi:MAG: hypothetical protein R3324_06600 [Halobacteriales archaeon]|nr:hypothetical protein [Halobacteriales archaeon]
MSIVDTSSLETNGDTMYERLSNLVDEHGEVMVRFDSGAEHELHRHNVQFLDEPMVKVVTPDAVYWFDAERIESYWIHYEY